MSQNSLIAFFQNMEPAKNKKCFPIIKGGYNFVNTPINHDKRDNPIQKKEISLKKKEIFNLEREIKRSDQLFDELSKKAFSFYEILAFKRKSLGLGINDIANLTSLPVDVISDIESGRPLKIDINIISKLSKVYGIEPDQFVYHLKPLDDE